MKKRPLAVWIAFLATLGSGLIDIRSVIGPSLPGRHSLLSWEPRYEIYQNVLDLPRLAYALNKVATVGGPEFSGE
jgi:hypothetical protein